MKIGARRRNVPARSARIETIAAEP